MAFQTMTGDAIKMSTAETDATGAGCEEPKKRIFKNPRPPAKTGAQRKAKCLAKKKEKEANMDDPEVVTDRRKLPIAWEGAKDYVKFFEDEESRIGRALSDLDANADVQRRYLRYQLSVCDRNLQEWRRKMYK